MSLFNFAYNNPITTFCTVYILALAVTGVVKNLLRFLSICINGYPPPHCDALGKEIAKDEEHGDD